MTPDGARFLMIRPTEPPEIAEIAVVFNWFEQLMRTVMPTR